MTIFDVSGLDKYICMDEGGNAYVTMGTRECNLDADTVLENIKGIEWIDHNTYLIPKEVYDRYCEYSIEITDDEDIYSVESIRRPYYRMRGKKVTREQAFDIIRRTDNFFSWYMDDVSCNKDYVGGCNFDNWLIQKNHYPEGYGWIHVDGTVGCNSITQKYPTVMECVCEWLTNLIEFPYLDLVIAFTFLNEGIIYDSEDNYSNIDDNDNDFADVVLMGIEIHDKQIKVTSSKEAVDKYNEYDNKYGVNAQIYKPEYYGDNKIIQVDEDYLRKCIESYGLDADKELSGVPEYVWKENELKW